MDTSPKPWISQRTARVVIGVALVIKLLIVVWNAVTYNNTTYDFHRHKGRAAAAGLRVSKSTYNQPLYYLQCLPFVEDIQKAKIKEGYTHRDLINFLRFANVPYIFLFYILWLYFIIPRLIPDWKAASIASMVLLGFPGFQKLAVMSHPDNLVLALSAAGIAFWLWFRGRSFTTAWRDWAAVIGFGVIVGLLGLTRPFAAAPVFVLSVAGVLAIAQGRRLFSVGFLSRAAVFTLIVGTLSLSWFVYRWHETGWIKAGYDENWVGQFRPYRKDLDRVHYFTSFYFADLIREPNMLNEAFGYNGKPKVTNDMSNSFLTIAYSEFWGDHWLYFSSSRWRTEQKLWPKRVLFVVAFLILPLLAVRFFGGVRTSMRRMIRREPDGDVDALLVLYVLLGGALYFYWLTGEALLPGANTPIKFIYNAHLMPVIVAIAFLNDLGPRRYNAWFVYSALVFITALPVATFWPTR
jgi:hypothetical protein